MPASFRTGNHGGRAVTASSHAMPVRLEFDGSVNLHVGGVGGPRLEGGRQASSPRDVRKVVYTCGDAVCPVIMVRSTGSALLTEPSDRVEIDHTPVGAGNGAGPIGGETLPAGEVLRLAIGVGAVVAAGREGENVAPASDMLPHHGSV